MMMQVDDGWSASKYKKILEDLRTAITEEYQFKILPSTRYMVIDIKMDLVNSWYNSLQFFDESTFGTKCSTNSRAKEREVIHTVK